jgi:hypothetical protein
MHEKGEGRPRGALTTDDNNAHRESEFDRPHAELVVAFRDYIDHAMEYYKETRQPEYLPSTVGIIIDRLNEETSAYDDPIIQKRIAFYKR